MGLLDVNLNDAGELKIIPDNEEVQLRIKRLAVVPMKKDPARNNIMVTFEVPSEPMADDIWQWIPIPCDVLKGQDEKAYIKCHRAFVQFCSCFGLEMPMELDEDNVATDAVGLEGWAIIKEEPGQDGNMQNSVRRFVVAK